MADNPLVIKIPPGATEIDLRPVLEPIILALMPRIHVNAHSSREPRPEDIPGFVKSAAERLEYEKLLPFLKRQVLKDYLEANGWKPESAGYDSVYIRHGDRVNLMASDDVFDKSTHYPDESVRQVQYGTVGWYRKTKLFVIKKILASRSILDQLAAASVEDSDDDD
jgi:hypothetical protein